MYRGIGGFSFCGAGVYGGTARHGRGVVVVGDIGGRYYLVVGVGVRIVVGIVGYAGILLIGAGIGKGGGVAEGRVDGLGKRTGWTGGGCSSADLDGDGYCTLAAMAPVVAEAEGSNLSAFLARAVAMVVELVRSLRDMVVGDRGCLGGAEGSFGRRCSSLELPLMLASKGE